MYMYIYRAHLEDVNIVGKEDVCVKVQLDPTSQCIRSMAWTFSSVHVNEDKNHLLLVLLVLEELIEVLYRMLPLLASERLSYGETHVLLLRL